MTTREDKPVAEPLQGAAQSQAHDCLGLIGQIAGKLDLKSLERMYILQTLAAVNGSRRAAVERLGISERTLRNKLRQYRFDARN